MMTNHSELFELFTHYQGLEQPQRLRFLEGLPPDLKDALLRLDAAHRQIEQGTELKRVVAQCSEKALDDAALLHLERQRFGRYQLQQVIGSGGMGVVYRAHRVDGRLEHTAAIKLIYPGIQGVYGGRLLQHEARVLLSLDHPGIARMYDFDEANGIQYLTMELIDGCPLDRYLDTKRLCRSQRVRLLIKVAEALLYAHQKRVIHGDIKPSNILVDGGGNIKLIDFGIANSLAQRPSNRVTARSSRFAPPESEQPDNQLYDLYCLGETIRQCQGAIADPELEAITRKLTHPDSSKRYASSSDLLSELNRLRRGQAVDAVTDRLYRLKHWFKARRVPLAATLVCMVFAGTYLQQLLSSREQINQQRVTAQRTLDLFLESLSAANPEQEQDKVVSVNALLQHNARRLINTSVVSDVERALAVTTLRAMNAISDNRNAAWFATELASRPRLMSEEMMLEVAATKIHQRQFDEAEALLARHCPESETADGRWVRCLLLRGEGAYLKGEIQQARDYLGAAMQRQPLQVEDRQALNRHVKTATLYADVLFSLGESDASMQVFSQLAAKLSAIPSPPAQAAELYTTWARLLSELGNTQEAARVLEMAAPLIAAYYGKQSDLYSLYLFNQIQNHDFLKQYDQALALMAELEPLSESLFGKGSDNHLVVMRFKAALQGKSGQPELAKQSFEQAIEAAKESLELPGLLNDLAILHFSQQHYAEAEPLLKRSLALGELPRYRDERIVSQPVVKHNLCRVYLDAGQPELALPFCEQAESELGGLYPSGHRLTVEVMDSLYRARTETGTAFDRQRYKLRWLAMAESQFSGEALDSWRQVISER